MTVQRTTTHVCAADIMTNNPVRVTPDVTAVELAKLLDANDISGVPVVDSLDRVIGVVSKTDLLHRCVMGPIRSESGSSLASLQEGMDSATQPDELGVVEEFMGVDPITALPDEPINVLAGRMAEERIHRIIVVDKDRHVLGIITSLDLLKEFPALTR